MAKSTKHTSEKKRRLSVIISAFNEERTIGALVRRLKDWSRRPEVIVVANGCTDHTASLARRAGARVIRIREPIGHDVGRAIGIDAASGRVCLVIDADMLYEPRELEPFVRAVESGVDIALNQYPTRHSKAYHHPVSVARRALNLFLQRPELCAASLTAVPHAVSHRAVRKLGAAAFAVPPVAQARAVLQGLRVQAAAHVAEGPRNPLRKAAGHSVRKLIIGDCLEAVSEICRVRGIRGGFTDLNRRRSMLTSLTLPQSEERQRYRVVAVIPVRNEQTKLSQVIKGLRAAKVENICVITNGSNDDSAAVAASSGANVLEFPDSFGHDVGRAAGYILNRADKYVFLDGDVPVSGRNVVPFIRALTKVDVALNRLDDVIGPGRQKDTVSTVKRFLNLAMNRADLGIASLTAIPHGIRARVVERIGAKTLAVPPLAQVKAVLAGFRVRAVHGVNVVDGNKRRFLYHSKQMGKPTQKMILGDHLEALSYLLRRKGPRGPYPDNIRKRDWVYKWKANADS